MRLRDKVCYVTGAASGIGEAIARRFLDEGARIALVDRNADLLERVAQVLGSGAQERVRAFAIDVGDTLAETAAAWGRIDVGVNSAGTLGPVGRLHEIDPGDYRELVDNNLHGVFNCLRHQLAHMSRAGGGSIVNISSAAGLVGFPTAAAYTAAKHGVVGLTRTCAIDYAADNVRVNAIAPGGVDTPLIRATTCATAEGRAMIESLHPMRRLADPAEIASAALFLASDEASFVTGETFSVDGGWVAW